jgi:hypothetical protein
MEQALVLPEKSRASCPLFVSVAARLLASRRFMVNMVVLAKNILTFHA